MVRRPATVIGDEGRITAVSVESRWKYISKLVGVIPLHDINSGSEELGLMSRLLYWSYPPPTLTIMHDVHIRA